MTEEDKEEKIEEGDDFEKVRAFTLSEIEKAKSRKSLFETFDVNPNVRDHNNANTKNFLENKSLAIISYI